MSRQAEPLSTVWRLVPVAAMVAAGLVLALGVATAAYSEATYRADKRLENTVKARILAATVSAALSFDDTKAAQEYVDAMSADPQVEAVAIYNAAGRLFVMYKRKSNQLPADPLPRQLNVRRRSGIITVPVGQAGVHLGTVALETSVEPITQRLQRYAGIALLVGMASVVFAVLGAAHAVLSRAHAVLATQTAALGQANHQLQSEIAEREKAEAALRQTQKMEAVGQLSGGIAHDFNNLLQAVSSCLVLIRRNADTPETSPLIDAGLQAVDRGAKLTQQLMAFTRRETLRPEPVDVADRLLGLSELLARALRADIALVIDLQRGLWPIDVDPTQFDLAILNLAVNARDAMAGDGRLVISGRNLIVEPGSDPTGPLGECVLLDIADSGSGMSRDVLDRAFEPFFTTKGVGKGTGLGLSQVYGFARQSGGIARIDSRPGRGTTISLLLPRSAAMPIARKPDATRALQAGAGRRLLLVEDDPIVGAVMAATCTDLGYVVARAVSADEALALLERGEPFDILFSDIVMPGTMNGVDLARVTRRLRPDLPILLTSGYSAGLDGAEKFRILPKPYRIDELATALGDLANSQGSYPVAGRGSS